MTMLSSMRPEVFDEYLPAAITGYADDNVLVGRWPAQGAVERSRAEFHSLLPQGLGTPGNHLYEIKASDSGPTVGYLWFAVEEHDGSRGAFVYDVEVKPDHRRQGHARRAFLALEPIVAGLGLSRIGLHVFGHNAAAQALYGRLGYAVIGIQMLKKLDPLADDAASPDRP